MIIIIYSLDIMTINYVELIIIPDRPKDRQTESMTSPSFIVQLAAMSRLLFVNHIRRLLSPAG